MYVSYYVNYSSLQKKFQLPNTKKQDFYFLKRTTFLNVDIFCIYNFPLILDIFSVFPPVRKPESTFNIHSITQM